VGGVRPTILIIKLSPPYYLLPKTERLTVEVECSVQSGGIATAAALSLFSGEELQAAQIVSYDNGL
jgi:hypothetical protein